MQCEGGGAVGPSQCTDCQWLMWSQPQPGRADGEWSLNLSQCLTAKLARFVKQRIITHFSDDFQRAPFFCFLMCSLGYLIEKIAARRYNSLMLATEGARKEMSRQAKSRWLGDGIIFLSFIRLWNKSWTGLLNCQLRHLYRSLWIN